MLIAARTADAYRALRDAFGAGQVEKDYLAIIDGRPVSRECDAPLAQRGKHVVVDHTDGLAAHTQFIVERATDDARARPLLARDRPHAPGARAPRARRLADHRRHALRRRAARRITTASSCTRRGWCPADLVIEAPLPARFAAARERLGLTS